MEVIKLLIPFFNTNTLPSRETLQLALAWAASRGHIAAVEALLDAGAEINEVTPTGHTALMLAASNGHVDTVRVLLEKNASPVLENNDGGTALDLAERNHHEKVGKYLRRHISDDPMEAPHSSAASSTSSACTDTSSSGSTSSTSTTTSTSNTSSSQTHIDHALQPGWRLLNSAAEAGDMGRASLLLHNRIPIDTEDACGNTCLILGAQAGNVKFVTFWLEENADIEHTNDAGNTALILAASNGHESTVLELLAYGANILRTNNTGMNAKQCAAKNSHRNIENLLHGALAFLKAAAQENVVEFEKTLNKAWLNCVDGSGSTALHIAVKNGCTENAKLLIKKRAKLDVQDNHGNTALLIAANHPGHREELLKAMLSDTLHLPNLLLKNKANTGIRDLLDQAKFHFPVPRTLLLGAFTKSGKALLEACTQGKFPHAQTLLMCGADTTLQNRDGNCALHVAAIDGNHDIVQLLLDHGAMIDVVNEENLTALHLAARHGHIGVVYQLLRNGASSAGIAAALLYEEANAAQDQISSSGSTSQAATNPKRDIVLDLLEFDGYLSGADAEMPLLAIPLHVLLKSFDDVNARGKRPHETLSTHGLSWHIIAGLRERSAEGKLFEKAMVAKKAAERATPGQKQACRTAVLSLLWGDALGSKVKESLANDHIPTLAVQRYSRLLKQQVMWLLNTAARAENAIFEEMLAFDTSLEQEFAGYGSYHPVAHYHHLRNCGMASLLADFITSRYLRVVGGSDLSSISKNGFAKAVHAALNAQEFIQMLDKWFKEAQDDPSFRAILNRQIDQLKLACQQLLKGDKSE